MPASTPPLLHLHEDVLNIILSVMSIPSLVRLRSTCHTADSYVAYELDRRYCALLAVFVHDARALRAELDSANAVISGSAALSLASDLAVTPANLNIYTPRTNLFHVLAYLVHIEQYSIVGYSPRRGKLGLHCVITVGRGSRRVQIAQSRVDRAMLPVFHFWSTAPMLYFTGSSVSIAYPRLLEGRRALLNPLRDDFSPTTYMHVPRVIKYVAFGVDVRARSLEWLHDDAELPPCDRERAAECPLAVRWLADHHSLTTDLTRIARRRPARVVEANYAKTTVVWWRGGLPCSALCSESGEAIDASVRSQPIAFLPDDV